MTARKRSRIPVDWFRKRIEKLRKNHEFGGKTQTIIELGRGVYSAAYFTDQGWSDEQRQKEGLGWREDLTKLTCMAVSPNQGRPALLERIWASRTGKNWKALKSFPERLRKMADEVERINAGDPVFFARTPRWNVDRHESEKLGVVCEQLPDLMRSYGRALAERNAFVSQTAPRSGSSTALFELSNLVKHLTGKYRDRQVAELLQLAANLLGETMEFDALSIAQARARHKKKRART